MPGFLLHLGAEVMCAHAGTAQPVVVNPRVQVSGQPITVQPDVYVIAGCTFPPPPVGNGPCVTATWIMGAMRVKAEGIPVLLQDSEAICTRTGTPLEIVMTQERVKGM